MAERRDSTIWITGAGGLIGSYLLQTANEGSGSPRPEILGLTRPMLELTDFAAVRERFRRDNPGLIIHCAALTRAVACEEDPALARKVNVELTRFLAELAADVAFLFISTDLVFDGKEGWYGESAAVNPLTAYAETKVEA